jgi:phosphoglycerate dehydrogenase-like enzyme
MTQILVSAPALDRIADRLLAVAPDADVVSVTADGTWRRDGEPVDEGAIRPDVVWLSFDTFRTDALRALFRIIVDDDSAVRWVQTFNAGLDLPVWKTVLERGIRLTKSSAQAPPIAEYVVAHALSLIVPIDQQRALQQRHEWANTPYREISHTTWTLVGYGAIGREIAARVVPFGVDLRVVRRTPQAADGATEVVDLTGLPHLLPSSDVVVLAAASNDETRGMADEAFFRALKPGAILINIARGNLIDEDALRDGLDRSQPATAVLDVMATEPLPAEHWMWDHPQVRVTAHTSNSGSGIGRRGDELFLDNLARFLAGDELRNEAAPFEVGL